MKGIIYNVAEVQEASVGPERSAAAPRFFSLPMDNSGDKYWCHATICRPNAAIIGANIHNIYRNGAACSNQTHNHNPPHMALASVGASAPKPSLIKGDPI